MLCFRSKLLDAWTVYKGHIIFVCRGDSIWMTLGGFLDHLEKGHRFFDPVDHKSTVEDLVAAVLRVDL